MILPITSYIKKKKQKRKDNLSSFADPAQLNRGSGVVRGYSMSKNSCPSLYIEYTLRNWTRLLGPKSKIYPWPKYKLSGFKDFFSILKRIDLNIISTLFCVFL